MQEPATLEQRLKRFRQGSGLTVADLLRAVSDVNERNTWQFFFALFRTVVGLERGSQEYCDGYDYFSRYVGNGRCMLCSMHSARSMTGSSRSAAFWLARRAVKVDCLLMACRPDRIWASVFEKQKED
jgi:hypothetical protein